MYLKTKLPPAETEPRTDPFTLPALIAWLRTKNPDGAYCYMSNGRCLIGQYLTFIGIDNPNVGPIAWLGTDDGVRLCKSLPCGWNDIAAYKPHTFRAALKRAEAML